MNKWNRSKPVDHRELMMATGQSSDGDEPNR